MKRKSSVLLGFLLSLILVFFFGGRSFSGWDEVRWVDDGDTVVLSGGQRVRYLGINTPEVGQKDKPAERFGEEAKAVNGQLVYKKTVRLELDREKQDQYGRLLAYVFLEDGTFVNAELIKYGYAYFVFRHPNKKYDQLFLRHQREAMIKKVGMWRDMEEAGEQYIGNSRSKRFHKTNCPFGKDVSGENRVILKTKYDAFWEGYSPCKRCSP